MSTTLVGPEIEAPPESDRSGGGGVADPGSGDHWGREGGSARRYDPYQTGVWILLIPIVMFFVGLTSSLVVRKGASDDWVSIAIPRILGLNTLILLVSSASMEMARRFMNTGISDRMKTWLWVTTGLGTVFLSGQVVAWKQLARQGAFLSSNPSSSFFYVLTASHGMHLLGGMTALIYLSIRALRNEFGIRRQSALKATAVYWHFMDVLWIYLLLLLIFGR